MGDVEIKREKAQNEDLLNPCIVFHDGKIIFNKQHG